MKITRRTSIKLMTAGSLGLLSSGFILPLAGKRHIVTLSFDDGFEKSSIKTAEIYEKHNLSCCLNVLATAHRKDFVLPNEYHRWKAGDFTLWNDLKKRGHEIMPHGYKHANLGKIPLPEAKDLVEKCIDVFGEELEGYRSEESVFSLPHNSSTPELEGYLKTRFRAIRTHGDGVHPLPYAGMFRLGCASSGPECIDEHLTQTVNDFLEGPSGWLIYNTHGLDDEGWGPLSSGLLDEMLDRLNKMENVQVFPVIPALDTAPDYKVVPDGIA